MVPSQLNSRLGFINPGLTLPSSKRLQFANWKITIFKFGQSTISMGHFRYVFYYQRVDDEIRKKERWGDDR